jgi:hypothetical protein
VSNFLARVLCHLRSTQKAGLRTGGVVRRLFLGAIVAEFQVRELKPRNKRLHPVLICFIFRSELGTEPSFFDLQLTHEGNKHKGKAGEGRNGAKRDCGAEQGQNKATINRVPDPSVKSGLNYTMVLFQSDAAAPVFSQVHPGPNGEAQPCDRERQAGACPFGLRPAPSGRPVHIRGAVPGSHGPPIEHEQH